LARLRSRIDRGLAAVAHAQRALTEDTLRVQAIAACFEPNEGARAVRQARFAGLTQQLTADPSHRRQAMARVMTAFAPGLFVGPEAPDLPADNLALERFLRLPNPHQRHTHGHAHAGAILVQRGATRVPTLDAHRGRDTPFTPTELAPYLDATPPASQHEADHRHRVMRQARSRIRRAGLLHDLERRFLDSG
jgi:hypothetical protein